MATFSSNTSSDTSIDQVLRSVMTMIDEMVDQSEGRGIIFTDCEGAKNIFEGYVLSDDKSLLSLRYTYNSETYQTQIDNRCYQIKRLKDQIMGFDSDGEAFNLSFGPLV
ncbi:hypothetical protein [Marinomonas algarum]|uniref:Uncharacterized protein n=1 Tax=Marinomonas algarum TaxID=2883105 RepID=A0A9X1IR49_9GAMM|nr:hypothetical protein [Marinomonas algarum]MCB5162736.1 hypothetical protein [Marinomonas algarum]